MGEARVSVNQFPYAHLDPELFLTAASRAGFDGVGLAMSVARSVGEDKLADLLVQTGLSATSLCVSMGRIGQGARPYDGLVDDLELAGRIGVPLVVVAGHEAGFSTAAVAEVGEALARLAPRAVEVGSQLMIEPLTPVLAELTCLTSLREAEQVLSQAPGVRLVLDLWHSWRDPDFFDLVPRLAARTAIVHLSDYRFQPHDPLARVMLGDGLIDLEASVGAARSGGFDGWWELEVIADEPVGPDGLDVHLEVAHARIRELLR